MFLRVPAAHKGLSANRFRDVPTRQTLSTLKQTLTKTNSIRRYLLRLRPGNHGILTHYYQTHSLISYHIYYHLSPSLLPSFLKLMFVSYQIKSPLSTTPFPGFPPRPKLLHRWGGGEWGRVGGKRSVEGDLINSWGVHQKLLVK